MMPISFWIFTTIGEMFLFLVFAATVYTEKGHDEPWF